jgi:type VI secretion system protein ImpG
MDDLLTYFERELIYLRQQAAEFAARFPGPASRLRLTHDGSSEPHVERMIQATALLTARVNKSLEDGYPQLTESLLDVLFPHYLRPFPSCAIVRACSAGADTSSERNGPTIPRGTELRSLPVDGVPCRFRTCYDIRLPPVRLTEARFTPLLAPGQAIDIPANCGMGLAITIAITDPQHSFASLADSPVRIYISGDPSLAAVTRDTLCSRAGAAYVEADTGTWTVLPEVPLSAVGFAADEALVPFSSRSHPAYRPLTEYFTFPEKFNFVDLNLAKIAPHVPPACRCVTLHLALAEIRSDSHEARLLSNLSANNLLQGCSPVVNLFRQTAVPILVTHERADYPLLPDAEHARAYDIHSVDSVNFLGRREHGGRLTEFRPFYSLRHGEGTEKKGHYYVVRRDEASSAGHEHSIAFVDADFEPAECEQATVSIELSCSNRDLPTRLDCGRREGDLVPDSNQKTACTVSLLRRPTTPYRFAATPGLHWRLISHLALNFHSLVQEGLDAFREMLTLYNLAQSPTAQRQIRAIVGLAHHPTTAWIRDKHGASLIHGIEVRMTVEEEGYAGSGLHLFSQVIDHFLSQYVQINSFTQLVILSSRSEKELIRCKPRNGDRYLV